MTAEREPHPALCATAHDIADHLIDTDLLAERLVRFEMQILAETGFGLDLARCAATGSTDQLVYVSPKSGRAVSLAAGAPYRERLLALPAFLRGGTGIGAPSPADLWAGFALTGYFLRRDLFEPRGEEMPEARSAYLATFRKRRGMLDRGAVTDIPSALLPMLG
jgi:DNA repair protein RecO (recombination protein O)